MRIKLLTTFCFLTFSTLSFAETCPTPKEIKNNYFHGWQALNSNSGSPLTPVEMTQFTIAVQQFSLAEWMQGAPEGESHCYYTGADTQDKSYLNVFLAKSFLTPDYTSNTWQKISEDIAQCHGDIDFCLFKPKSVFR
jgi:hypothetical protein